MKQYEKIKKDIAECDYSMEMAGLLAGIEAASIIYCKHNYPDEVYTTTNGESKVSIYGIQLFLESEI